MKIRNSLVSNSSSASYILEIKNMDMDTFSSIVLCEYSYEFFNIEGILKKLEVNIKDYEGKTDDSWYKDWLEDAKKHKKIFTKLLDSNDNAAKVKAVLKYRNIEFSEKDNNITLKCSTSMHNSFNEGLNEVMKEIALYFMFEDNYELIASVEHD